jgi:protein ImuA
VRIHRLAALRQVLAKLEKGQKHGRPELLPLAVLNLRGHLPKPGLACGVLHEVVATAHGDKPTALGFVLALMASALTVRPGPAVVVISRRALVDFGRPYGHGLRQLGIDTQRVVLIETLTEKDALWALEEALRSEVRPAAVAGTIGGGLNLITSRRLNLAAAAFGTPLLLLRTGGLGAPTAAATRWRIGAAPAVRDRFGALVRRQWHAALERCRNGHPGQWFIEWNHVAHRFDLVESVADCAPATGAGLRRAG